LKQLARQTGSTLFIVMFSIYLVLLSRLSDQMEVTCSIISAGRKHPSLHHIVGFFVNSIPFKIHVDHGERFDDFLQRVKDEVLEIFLYQNYPLEPVFKELKMKYPEIPVSFNMLNLSTACAAKELKSLAPYHIEKSNDVKFDMEAYVMEYKNGIRMTWNYKRSLLKPSFIEYIAGEYLKLADFFTAHSGMTPGAYGQNKKKRRFRRKK
jgi:non-ribosomal peptide synthetase component F